VVIEEVKRFLNSALFRGGSVMTVAGVLGGILGYVYQILMGRMLAPGEYALLSALMALLMFTGSPLSALTMAVTRQVSSLQAQSQRRVLWKFFLQSNQIITVLLIVLSPFFYIFSDTLGSYLKTQSLLPVYLFGLILLIGALLAVVTGFLQGLKCFVFIGSAGIFAAILKIASSVFFVFFEYGVPGAACGIVLSSLIVWICCIWLAVRKIYVSGSDVEKKFSFEKILFSIKSFYPVLLANIAFTAMTQLDMVIVNNLFDSETAGNYAAASVLGKAVLYLPGGLVFALFPLVAENLAKKASSANLLFQAVFATSCFCAFAAIFYFFFSGWLIDIFYGDRYSSASELLRWYGLAVFPMALVMVAEHFLIAQGRVLFTWLFLAMAPLQILAILTWHQEVWMVLVIIGSFGALTALIGYSLIWREYRKALN